MRQSLQINNIQLKDFSTTFSEQLTHTIQEQMAEWIASDFAGFRRILDANSDCAPNLSAIETLAKDRRMGSGKLIRHFIVLGTGGSSLGSEAIFRALHKAAEPIQFHFADNNDPEWFHQLLQSLQPEETLFYVVSKSGKTPETLSQFLFAIEWVQQKTANWQKHFVLCTDPNKGDLREVSRRLNLACLDVPPAVGGRFSVLTPVGLFPAAFAAMNVSAFLAGASSIVQSWESLPLDKNPAALLAHSLVQKSKEKSITVFMPYSSHLTVFSKWFCQLWAESLGKEGKGLTPYPASGTTDQHSQMQLYMEGPTDKAIVLLQVRECAHPLPLHIPESLSDLASFQELKGCSMLDLFNAEFSATRDALTKQGIPNITIEIDRLDEYSLGALFFFWEWVTAFAGAFLTVNPFDQPGVEAAKILTKQYLSEQKK